MFEALILTMLLLQDLTQQKRVINIYVKDTDNITYRTQIKELDMYKGGLKERDLVIHKIFLNSKTEKTFNQHHIYDAFTFVLIGKDGGEKYRSSKMVSAEKLFSIIDAMPMRKDEMKQQQH